MTTPLPTSIADYIDANARLDVDGMVRTFGPDAILIDNGERFEGRTAIRHLFETEVIAVKAVFTPDTARREGGDIVVEGPVRGDFPGSPLRFTYRFALAKDAIRSLEITL